MQPDVKIEETEFNMSKAFRRTILVAPFASIISMVVIVSTTATSPSEFSRSMFSVLALATIFGLYISYTDTPAGGILTSALCALLLSLASAPGTLELLGLYSIGLGLLLGAILRRYPMASLLLAVLNTVILLSYATASRTVYFLSTYIVISLIREYSAQVSEWLYHPFRQLHLNRHCLLAFGSVYIVVALTFALFLKTAYHIDPLTSFDFSDRVDNDSFVAFVYFSFSALQSSLPPEITPRSHITRIMATLESLCGIFLLIVFFRFLLDDSNVHSKS